MLELTILYRFAASVINTIEVSKFNRFSPKIFSECGFIDALNYPAVRLLIKNAFYLCIMVKRHIKNYNNLQILLVEPMLRQM